MASAGTTTTADVATNTRKEAEIYDRQIRLWGAESQAKMSKAKVLYIHITGSTSEIIKNLVLAGIRAVLCDPRPYPDAVLDSSSLFLRRQLKGHDSDEGNESSNKKRKYESVAHAVQPIVEELNPLLTDCEIVTSFKDLVLAASKDSSHLAQYSAIVASRICIKDACILSKAITAVGGTFYLVDSFGMYGVSAFDLGPDYQYRPEHGKGLLDLTKLKTHVTMDKLMAVPLQHVTNRFHKTPPEPWVYYKCLLNYMEMSNSSVWPVLDDEMKVKDFVDKTHKWIIESSNGEALADLDILKRPCLERLAKVAHREVAPICSVIGGLIGNEVIKAISGKGEPANNTMLLDGRTCKSFSFLVQPKD